VLSKSLVDVLAGWSIINWLRVSSVMAGDSVSGWRHSGSMNTLSQVEIQSDYFFLLRRGPPCFSRPTSRITSSGGLSLWLGCPHPRNQAVPKRNSIAAREKFCSPLFLVVLVLLQRTGHTHVCWVVSTKPVRAWSAGLTGMSCVSTGTFLQASEWGKNDRGQGETYIVFMHCFSIWPQWLTAVSIRS
jgi:hypothetical protein